MLCKVTHCTIHISANTTKANALEGKQKVGFPTNTEEQEIENAKEQQLTNNGVVYTRWGSSAWWGTQYWRCLVLPCQDRWLPRLGLPSLWSTARCYAKSPTAQNIFQPIPGLINCGIAILCTKCSQVQWEGRRNLFNCVVWLLRLSLFSYIANLIIVSAQIARRGGLLIE